MGYKNLCHASKFEPPHGNLKTNLQEIIFFLYSSFLSIYMFLFFLRWRQNLGQIDDHIRRDKITTIFFNPA